jgi:hypothetical protein
MIDAARYRWLRDHLMSRVQYWLCVKPSPETLDEMLDYELNRVNQEDI